ncbi:MAG: hypothetical protein ACRBCL_07365 [Maritimibacter sp.]
MQAKRIAGYAPQTETLARDVTALKAGCVGCSDCKGLCQELIDAMLVPGLVLKGKDA